MIETKLKKFHIHLVSDATGDTIHSLARACISQFDAIQPIEHFWNMVRNERQLAFAIEGIEESPGIVLMTLVNDKLRSKLITKCRELQIPCIPVLDPVMSCLANYLGQTGKAQPGRQYALDDEYFDRIEAMDFVLQHDDGQTHYKVAEADVVLVGVSRTSKTPTCIYLGNRGIKAANIPFVPGVTDLDELKNLEGPLFIGLTANPKRLVDIRRSRMKSINNEVHESSYTDIDKVETEVADAKKFFKQMRWPIIDVTSRSIEETVAEIHKLLNRHLAQKDA